MQDIKQRELKMQEKRKQTSWKTCLKEIASWVPFVLHKNAGMISRYPFTERIIGIQKTGDFESGRETYTKYGREYDFNKNFWDNFEGLIKTVPFPNLVTYGGIENSDFADTTHNTKNAYLVFNSVRDNQNILYSSCIKERCSDVQNSVMVRDGSQNIYFGTGIIKSYKIFFSRYIVNSSDIRFSSNLTGCSDCLFCDGLVNQKYCIYNQQCTQEEYLQKKNDIVKQKVKFAERHQKVNIQGNNFGSTDVQGNFIINSEKIENGSLVYQIKEGKNLVIAGSAKGNERMYDLMMGGSNISNDFYGVASSGTSQYVYIGESIGMSSNIYYSLNVQDCSFCLGCIGLKNKSFCIFNKEYSKEEWFELANKIFAQMDSDGSLGMFFPGKLSPYYFNDTLAYLIDDSFTKEEVTAEGYLRRDEEIKVDVPANAAVIMTTDLNKFQGFDEQGNREINPEILKKVIKDEKGNYYRIVPMELDFLQKHGLPLPEIHRLERIKLGFKFK